jgi:hypothetical protein
MQQQLAQLAAQLQQQQQQQQQGPNVVGVAPAASRAHPRLPAPPSYDGRAAGGVDTWLRELRKQFAWYGASLDSDAERIRFGSAHLSGVALDWWESIDGQQPTSWLLFEEALRTRFQPVNSADAARAALTTLQQGPRQPVHEYTTEFRRLLVALPRMEEGDRIYRYVAGLQPRLAGLVRMQAPATLANAIAYAARVDGLSSGEVVPPVSAAQAGASGGGAIGPATNSQPMELSHAMLQECVRECMRDQILMHAQLNALSSSRQSGGLRPGASSSSSSSSLSASSPFRVPSMSAGEFAERREQGLCFLCGKGGHRKFDCPQRA